MLSTTLSPCKCSDVWALTVASHHVTGPQSLSDVRELSSDLQWLYCLECALTSFCCQYSPSRQCNCLGSIHTVLCSMRNIEVIWNIREVYIACALIRPSSQGRTSPPRTWRTKMHCSGQAQRDVFVTCDTYLKFWFRCPSINFHEDTAVIGSLDPGPYLKHSKEFMGEIQEASVEEKVVYAKPSAYLRGSVGIWEWAAPGAV